MPPGRSVLLIGDITHCKKEWQDFSQLATLKEFPTGSRQEFLANCKSGRYDDVIAIYRSNVSTAVCIPHAALHALFRTLPLFFWTVCCSWCICSITRQGGHSTPGGRCKIDLAWSPCFLFLFSLPHSFPLLMISRFSGQITGPFDAELVKALPNSLAYICHNGAGYDNIDTTACSERGQSHGILGFCCWRLPSAAIGATRLTGKQESASQAHQLPSTMLPQISQCF
ncbi:hypothetical protein H106_01117 [Trichophyton rubrum CBS 735.88]|nr:hypothetical protein H106_01117 [Trichophyton rubrum CBS 735.88]